MTSAPWPVARPRSTRSPARASAQRMISRCTAPRLPKFARGMDCLPSAPVRPEAAGAVTASGSTLLSPGDRNILSTHRRFLNTLVFVLQRCDVSHFFMLTLVEEQRNPVRSFQKEETQFLGRAEGPARVVRKPAVRGAKAAPPGAAAEETAGSA